METNARAHLLQLIDRAVTTYTTDETKSVAGYVADYLVQLSRAVTDVLNGDSKRGDLSRVMRALIRNEAEGVYLQGVVEGGGADTEAEARQGLDDSDYATIEKWKSEQLGFVSEFTAAVSKAAGKPELQDSVLARVELWANAYASLGDLGRASGKANKMVVWKFGDTDHCATCAELDGKRHRLKWFTSRGYYPRKPGNDMLDCGGWRCQCGLYDDDGELVL